MVNVKDLQDVVDDLKGQAAKRASDLLGEGRGQVRTAIGGHSDGALIGTFALGILLGVVVGAAISLLYTPISGEEARKKIGRNVDRIRGGESDDLAGNGSTRPLSSVGQSPRTNS